jgi:hypothetical protein
MSDLIRFALSGDYSARIRRLWPSATDVDMAELDGLIATGRLVDGDGGPHGELVAWVQRIMDRQGAPAATSCGKD